MRKNYGRFYGALRALPGGGAELKSSIVMQYTGGRTEHVSEMSAREYERACEALEAVSGKAVERRKKRSLCLKLMQRIGIDTTDWARVNDFTLNARIAGKPFAALSTEELKALSVKLRMIEARGGVKTADETVKVIMMPTGAALN